MHTAESILVPKVGSICRIPSSSRRSARGCHPETYGPAPKPPSGGPLLRIFTGLPSHEGRKRALFGDADAFAHDATLRPVALTSSEPTPAQRDTSSEQIVARRCAPRRTRETLVPLRSEARCRNIGRLFRRALADEHSGRAPSTWGRLTRSRRRSIGNLLHYGPPGLTEVCYCHHDKHTRPLQPSSRTTSAQTASPLTRRCVRRRGEPP